VVPGPLPAGDGAGLARKGVPLSNIRYKFFGPADELLAV
jgi:hypothetical protein